MEGQRLRDRVSAFEGANCELLGISFDTVEENRTFAEAENFPFRLLSDTDKEAGALYDTIRSPDEPFHEYVPRRYSYLIDPQGTIAKAYEVKDVAAHADEVLEDLRALQGAAGGPGG